jgi:hypothetical protein
MSMSQDSQDFESLRRLLALKRYEQPPPGYFNHFSTDVIARIKAGEGERGGALERLFWEAPWLQRLWAALETKPIMAGAFGTAVCALLVAGVIYSESPDGQPLVSLPATTTTIPMELANNGPSPDQPVPVRSTRFSEEGAPADSITLGTSADGIFRLVPKPYAMPATFSLPGAN